MSGNGKNPCKTCGKPGAGPGECQECQDAAQKLLDDLKKKRRDDNK